MVRPVPSLGKIFAGFALSLLAAAWVHAGALEDLKSLSQLPPLDLAKLKSGEIVTKGGEEGNFLRGVSLESCYFIPAPTATVGAKLLHWDPTKHPSLETRLYHEYGAGSARDAFRTLRLTSSVSSDRWLLDHTFAITDGGAAGDLHLTAQEVEIIRKGVPQKGAAAAPAREARANDAWGEILRRRSDALTQGGISAIAPYGTDQAVSPGSEYRGLLTLNGPAAKHFRPLVGGRPLAANSSAADETVAYWETAQVRGHTTLQLGIFAARKSADSWQLFDCVYYPTDTYFMALDLFQLWPVEDGTLVWQVGFVSAPFRSYLGGADRYIAGKQMTAETIETIKAFRADFEKRR